MPRRGHDLLVEWAQSLGEGDAAELKSAKAMGRVLKSAPTARERRYRYMLTDPVVIAKISCRHLDFKVINPIALMCDLLADARNADGSIWKAEAQFTDTGLRKFSSAMHGDKCIRVASREVPGDCVMAAVCLYADDTWTSANGRHTSKPLNMVLGK